MAACFCFASECFVAAPGNCLIGCAAALLPKTPSAGFLTPSICFLDPVVPIACPWKGCCPLCGSSGRDVLLEDGSRSPLLTDTRTLPALQQEPLYIFCLPMSLIAA